MRALFGVVLMVSMGCGAEGVDPPADVEVTTEVEVEVRAEVDATLADLEIMVETGPAETETVVEEVTPKPAVGWCNLQFPTALILAPGQTSETLYGRAFVAGVTDVGGPGADYPIVMEVGVGNAPDAADWTWSAATFARDVGNDDEFEATVMAGAAGDYRFAFRARNADGDWSYCDATGLADGFAVADSGTLTVVVPPVVVPDYCRIQFPTEPITLGSGAEVEVFGVVYVPDITGETGSASPAVFSSVGYGPSGSTPDDSWTWTPGSFNVHVDNGFGQLTNDEHRALLGGDVPGSYAWAWRFAFDDGTGPNWRYCDRAGSTSYDPALAGVLTITPE